MSGRPIDVMAAPVPVLGLRFCNDDDDDDDAAEEEGRRAVATDDIGMFVVVCAAFIGPVSRYDTAVPSEVNGLALL